ncbi:MAG TPA: type 1 glutamine amidotransferase [Puia sp.]|jgi:GMP synthase-like glutamine amidotransferase
MRFHCLQHVPFETAGILGDRILEKGHSLTYTPFYRGNVLPPATAFDGLVIMGGTMSVHDEAEFPWLRAEKELIATAIRQKKKVLGICMGAQLIAEVSGGRVYSSPHKEIGFAPVRWTAAAGQRFPGLKAADARPVFHWHGETFDLPPGAVLLASTPACKNQAFLLGDHVLAVQFHPEVTAGIVRDMVFHEGHELITAPYIQSAGEMFSQLPLADLGWLVDALFDPFFY